MAASAPRFGDAPAPVPPRGSNWATRSVRDLVRAVQVANSQPDHPGAQEAIAEFYRRYCPYLMTVVLRQFGLLADRTGAREVVHDALLEFLDRCGRFELERTATDDDSDRQLRAYLGQLAVWRARNARDFQESFGRDAVSPQGLDEYPASGPTPDTAIVRDLANVEQWIDSLRPTEQEVLRAYFLDDHPGRKSDRLPDGVVTRLAAQLRTTPDNIRQIKLKLRREAAARFSPALRS